MTRYVRNFLLYQSTCLGYAFHVLTLFDYHILREKNLNVRPVIRVN